MGRRFKFHTQHLRDLLADVQKIAEEKWPPFEPEYQGNLVSQIAAILEPIAFDTEGAKVVEFDGTLAALIADVETITDDLNPGPEQGEWAKQVLASPGAAT
jgi:hypothetical protein